MNCMARILAAAAVASMAMSAGAGALDECMIRGDHAVVTRCLLDADNEAQAALNKVEGDAGQRARELDKATGRPGANAALAKTMRAFADYRKAQCDFVRAMYASGSGADQGQLGCRVDMTRRRVRDLQN
jgi:uncharacterized protein YecT (DUF1311 family)